MSRGKFFPCSGGSISLLSLLQILLVVVVLLHHHQTCDAITNNKTSCPPSSCGKITTIKYPFRLKNDPTTCGDPRYELSCENNVTTLTLFSGKYYVQEINYINYTIRIVDPGIEEGDCSSIPHYFLSSYNLTNRTSYVDGYDYLYQLEYELGNEYVIYLNCSKQVKDDPDYVDTAPCRVNSDPKSYVYAVARGLSVGSLKDYCEVKVVTMYMHSSDISSVRDDVPIPPDRPLSYEQIHGMLLYGFQLSWISSPCRDSCGNNQLCYFNRTTADFECLSNYCYYPMGHDGYCNQMSKLRILVEGEF